MRALIMPSVLALLFSGCSGGRGGTHGDGGGGGGPDMTVFGDVDLANGGCGTAVYQAQQAPAAMLVLLDRSASMNDNNKWTFAAQATVQAIDQDIFNTMFLGLMAAPSGDKAAPQCIQILGLPTVACAAPPFPQIDLALAGMLKSTDAMGVRHDMKTWLINNTPVSNGDPDSTPLYEAIQSGILALQAWPKMGKRILFVVTDGSIDCNQYSTRPGYADCNMCDHEWEDPSNIISLVGKANKDAQKPVDTFIVGVPGADTYDASGCNDPPYHMRNALSAIAYAGSPANVPANCTGKMYSQQGGDPAVSCHIDLTQGNFNAGAVANTISAIRGKVLGCVFDLPPVDGGMIDLGDVNVNYSVGGGMEIDLKKRADPNNMCLTDGCWDYTSDNKVQLIGKACDDVKGQVNAEVKIVVGCPTVIG